MVLHGSIWCQLSPDMTPTVSEHVLHADAGFIVNTIVFAIGVIVIAADINRHHWLCQRCRRALTFEHFEVYHIYDY